MGPSAAAASRAARSTEAGSVTSSSIAAPSISRATSAMRGRREIGDRDAAAGGGELAADLAADPAGAAGDERYALVGS